MKSLQEIEEDVSAMALRIGAYWEALPDYGTSRDSGYPHIEVVEPLYHYVIVARGKELQRRSSVEYRDLLYWLFSDITHAPVFACELTVPHRCPGLSTHGHSEANRTD